MQMIAKPKTLCLLMASIMMPTLVLAADNSVTQTDNDNNQVKTSVTSKDKTKTKTSAAKTSSDKKSGVELSNMEVVGTTPLHGVGLPADVIPSNVQTATGKDIAKTQSLDLSDFMAKTLGSVNINSAQNNPYQPDIQYRGYTASPLLGLPQGLAVYMDGVRLNSPFGDTVNWDTIPQSAISSINLMPGSNPIFGLNTLGGALSIESKNGFTNPGSSIQGYWGSFNRRDAQFESGGNDGKLSYFVTGNWFKEDGWRPHSPSEVKQFFTNLGYKNQDSTLNLTLTANNNTLNGNGPSPVQLLDQSYSSVFTYPDITNNRMQLVNLFGTHWINNSVMASGNVYYRHNNTTSFNSNSNEFTAGTGANAGYVVDSSNNLILDTNGNKIPTSIGGNTLDAVNLRGDVLENSGGFGLQLTFLQDLFKMQNQFVTGVSYDQGDSSYTQTQEVSSITPDRGVTYTGVYTTDGTVDVTAKNRTYGIYFTDTLTMTPALNLTLSGRYNNTHLQTVDNLDSTSSVNANHTFSRFNPSAGLTYAFTPAVNSYVSYSESSRAPTPSELGCSDPTQPCSLPNAFLADPPLKQVVAKSWEGGLRGHLAHDIKWNAGLFNTTNHDDIQFVGQGTTGIGYFHNVGETRRRGVELGMSGKEDKLSWAVNYTYLEAQYMSSFPLSSPFNPHADSNGLIHVKPGDNIPGLPKHNLKLSTNYNFTSKFSGGAEAIFNSNQFYRGDESNQYAHKVPGYAIINLNADYQISKHVKLFAKVNNLFDKKYANFGVLGDATEVIPGYTDPRFQGVGAPRAGWVGVKVSM